MKVNGEKIRLEKPVSIEKFINDNGYRRERIAVELNLSIIPKGDYEKIMLSDDDVLEIVSFMGGG